MEFVRKDIHCGLMGWKLLQKLDINPLDEETYELIRKLEKIKGKKKVKQDQECNVTAQEEAKKLEILLDDHAEK